MDPLETRVKTIIGKQLGKSTSLLNGDKKFKADLGADSLDAVSVMLELEDAFKIEIPDELAATIVTVQDAVDICKRLTSSKA